MEIDDSSTHNFWDNEGDKHAGSKQAVIHES